MRFALPRPSGAKGCCIFPVFLPFAGCPHRCLFCAQERQTGTQSMPLSTRLAQVRHQLLQRAEAQKASAHTAFTQGNKPVGACAPAPAPASCPAPVPALMSSTGYPDQRVPVPKKKSEGSTQPIDLAFYGGTFTALPYKDQEACMDLARWARSEGLIEQVRCSTRPDALEPSWLAALKDMGLTMVEVGVQSFHDKALTTVQRGYTGDIARQGCTAVRAAGLKLGIQLMPGMPGLSSQAFLEDTRTSLQCDPACIRMYPCLVIEGTPLANLWRSGAYVPWSLNNTITVVGQGLALAWEQGVPVIRLSLAPEPSLEAALLAGPRHEALGSLIQGEALLLRVEAALPPSEARLLTLYLPTYCQGFFAGHKGALLPRWKALGIPPETIRWHDQPYGEWKNDE